MGKICLRICCALALVVFVSASQACAGDGGSRTADMLVQAGGRNVAWMKSLHDTLPVCKVSIPGTHDSGTVKGGPMLKTQSTNIPAQLQQGIRAFDIRLEKKMVNWVYSIAMLFRIYIGKTMCFPLSSVSCRHILPKF